MIKLIFTGFIIIAINYNFALAKPYSSEMATEQECDYLYKYQDRSPSAESMLSTCKSFARIINGTATCSDFSWKYKCDINIMSDVKRCTAKVKEKADGLLVMVIGGEVYFDVLGGGSGRKESKIRIDNYEPFSFDSSSSSSLSPSKHSDIEKQIRNGSVIKTRYFDKNGTPIDQQFPICDLPKVIDNMKSKTK